jgi:hypothetical protein
LNVYDKKYVNYGVYGVIESGNEILDKDEKVIKWFGGNGINDRKIDDNEYGLSSYGFGGLLFDNYIKVINNGKGVNGGLNGIVGVKVG